MDLGKPHPVSRLGMAALGILPFVLFALLENLLCYFFSPKYWLYYVLSAVMWVAIFVLFYIFGIELFVKRILPVMSAYVRKRSEEPTFLLTLFLFAPMLLYTTIQLAHLSPGSLLSFSNLSLIVLNFIIYLFFSAFVYRRFAAAGGAFTIPIYIFHIIAFYFSGISGVFLLGAELQHEHWFGQYLILLLFCIVIPFLATLLFSVVKQAKLMVKAALLILLAACLLLLELNVVQPIRDHLYFGQTVNRGGSTNVSKGSQSRGKELPNIILIVMDTARAVNMSLYGYHRPTTPNLEEFAKEAVVFTRAISTAPWTLPSHASLFTGLPPILHGADRNNNEKGSWGVPLHNDFETLAEILAQHGYATGAVNANTAYVGPWTGLNQGFDFFWWGRSRDHALVFPRLATFVLKDEKARRLKAMCGINYPNSAKRINQIAARWLKQTSKKKPWFLFINYMEVHGISYLPPKYANMFTKPPIMKQSVRDERTGFFKSTDEELHQINAWYDNEMAALDNEIGKFLKFLKKKDLFKDTLIVVTADHGELLGEHDNFGHEFWLYHELLNVPLLVKYPSGQSKGEVSDEPVQNIDIFVELLTRAGIAVPPDLQGQPLHNVTHPIVSFAKRYSYYTEKWPEAFDHDLVSIYYSGNPKDYKLIRSSRGSAELYNMEQKPFETHPLPDQTLWQTIGEHLDKYMALMAKTQRKMPVNKPDKIDEATRKRLKSLGYIK